MATVVGLTVIKSFTYRGAAEEWSNDYWFSGSVPSDATAWRALFDALVTQEKTIYDSGVSVVRGYGHDSDDPHAAAVWSVDLTVSPNTPVSGTLSSGSGTKLPGDAACWARWKTSRVNTKGRAIYLRKYFHGAIGTSAGNGDTLLAGQVTALGNFGTKMMDGTFIDGRTIRSRLHSETLVSHGASSYSTTRTLKRRGKRP